MYSFILQNRIMKANIIISKYCNDLILSGKEEGHPKHKFLRSLSYFRHYSSIVFSETHINEVKLDKDILILSYREKV